MKTIEIKQKLVEEALDQLKAAQQDSYVQSTQNVIDELELALRQPHVVGRSEQLKAFLSAMIKEFDSGGVSWETRDSAESFLKSL